MSAAPGSPSAEGRLRIVHVLNTVRETGNGIINTAMDLAWGQARLGHEVHVVSAGGEYETRLAAWGVTHHRLDQSRRPRALLRALRAFRALLEALRPDVVHAHMVTGTLLVRAARRSRTAGGPLLVAHVHNVYQRSARLMGVADVVLCCGTVVATQMRARGVAADRLRVVLNGTVGSPRLPAPESVAPASLAHPAIVTVAGLNARKGIRELIGAFAQAAAGAPAATLYLVGDGPDRARFEAEVRASGVAARIHFVGFQRDPMPWLRAADVFVLASHRESFPIVLGEARAAGCAVVATAVDGVPEALDGGAAGLLVRPWSGAAPDGDDARPTLAEALARLLADADERARWRSAAGRGLERFHVMRMVDDTVALYRSSIP